MSEHTAFDFDTFKAFVLQNLRPDNLLSSLRAQRRNQPSYGYCLLAFHRFSERQAEVLGLDSIIRQADADVDIRAAIKRISEYGFEIQVNSYDEPSGRDLQVQIKLNDEAELTMRVTERLE